MQADTVALGVVIVSIGAVTLYVGRRAFPRLDLPREWRDLLRLTTAILAGGLITFGLVVVALGVAGW